MLIDQNNSYRSITDLSEMVDNTFAKSTDESNGKFLTTYEMIDILESHFPELNRSSNLNAELGKILRAKQFLFHKKKIWNDISGGNEE